MGKKKEGRKSVGRLTTVSTHRQETFLQRQNDTLGKIALFFSAVTLERGKKESYIERMSGASGKAPVLGKKKKKRPWTNACQ